MTGELTIFRNGSVPSTRFKDAPLPTQRLDDGVSAGFPRVSYKGSKWGIRYQGAYTPIQMMMQDRTVIQSPFLDVVILRAAGHPNKAWYAGAYTEGEQTAPPDCWSSNGAVPDAGAPNKQSRTCVGCPHNVWGSKVNRDTGQATRGKACMDSKRLAVVPVGDIENKGYGGPMMLSVPPSSLKRLGPYQNMLEANGFHYAAVWTRITFEPESAYPLFKFDAMAALDDVQADQVLKMLEHPMIDRILDAESAAVEAWDDSAQSVHSSIGAAAAPSGTVVTSGASVPASGNQVTSGNSQPVQPVTPPPPSAPAPSAPPQQQPAQPATPAQPAQPAQPQQAAEPDEPQAEQPLPTLPPGVTLPPGMTPEMAAAFLSQFAGAQGGAQKPARTRRRTPPVSPAQTDSAAVTGLAGPALPAPVGIPATPAAPAKVAAGNGADGGAVAQIMSTIGKLV
jgi:hypothetical protein